MSHAALFWHDTGFNVPSTLWPVLVARMAPREAAPSLPLLQGPPLHLCICMCPTVPSLAIIFLGFVSSYLTPSLFQHRAVGLRHWPLEQ